MSTTQLRVYQLPRDRASQDEWVAWWRDLSAPRRQFGFTITSALLDREAGVLTWMVTHDGDFADAEAAYMNSAERHFVFDRPHPEVKVIRVSIVEVLV